MKGQCLHVGSRFTFVFALICGAACSERTRAPPPQLAPAREASESEETAPAAEGETSSSETSSSETSEAETSEGETRTKDASTDNGGAADDSTARQKPTSWNCAAGEPVRSEERLDVHRKTGGVLGVVRVRLDDALNLRSGAGSKAAVVGTIPPTATALQPTGAACQVGRTIWYQVRWQGDTGWVSGRFVERLTPKHDFTQYFLEQGATHQSATPEAWARELVRQFNAKFQRQPEGKFEMILLGTQLEGNTAYVTVHTCCALDDSVAGRQATLQLVETAAGWQMKQAEGRYVCYRGTSGKLCI